MKKLLLLSLVLIATFAKAQTIDTLPQTNGKVIYQSIVDVPGASKDFIFYNASKWLLDIPNYVKGTILLQNPDIGQIFAEGSFKFAPIDQGLSGVLALYKFKIQIDCKNGKYRLRLFEITSAWLNNLDDVKTMEQMNLFLKDSNASPRHTRAANLDTVFKGILSSLQSALTAAANDDF